MTRDAERGDGPSRLARLASESSGVLGDLRRAASALARVDGVLRECLGAGLAPHVRTAAVDERRILVHVDSPAFAARVRYLAPAIAEALDRRFGGGAKRRIEVVARPAPESPASAAPPPVPAPISTRTRTLLLEVADTTVNERLAGVLRRLASRRR